MSAENYPSSTSQPLPAGYLLSKSTDLDVVLNGGDVDVPILVDAAGDRSYLTLPAGIWSLYFYLGITFTDADYSISSIRINVNEYNDAGIAGPYPVMTQTPVLQFDVQAALNNSMVNEYTSIVAINKPTRFSVDATYALVGEDTTIQNLVVYGTYLGPSVLDTLFA